MMTQLNSKETGLLVSQDFRMRRYRILYMVIFTIVLCFCLTVLLPCIWVLMSCFKSTQEFYSVPPTVLPNEIHLSKLVEAWKKYNFTRYYGNSILLAAGEIIFSVLFNGAGGYSISRLNPLGGKLITKLIFCSMLLPTSMTMVPLFMSFVNVPLLHINITDSYWPMYLMSAANAFNLLLFRSFFNGIDMGYIEAARIDGCNDIGIFIRIILPLSLPIVMVVSINTFNGAWSSFLWPYLIMKDKSTQPLAVQLYLLNNSSISIDKYMCVILFTVIPPSIVFIFFSKYIIGGINVGGIKG